MEIRRSYDRLISTRGFPILVRWHLYIDSPPWVIWCTLDCLHHALESSLLCEFALDFIYPNSLCSESPNGVILSPGLKAYPSGNCHSAVNSLTDVPKLFTINSLIDPHKLLTVNILTKAPKLLAVNSKNRCTQAGLFGLQSNLSLSWISDRFLTFWPIPAVNQTSLSCIGCKGAFSTWVSWIKTYCSRTTLRYCHFSTK